MEGHRYVTRGYSPYTYVPAQEDGYAYEPRQHNNWYTVETTTVERVRVPATRSTNFGGSPSIEELFREYMPRHVPRDHHGSYEPNYGSDGENSSPPRYHEHESLMNQFLNKIQIEASNPTKTRNRSNLNRYRPRSPTRSYPSEEAHLNEAQNVTIPNKYRSSSPDHRYPSEESYLTRPKALLGPKKYQPTSSMHNYPSEEGNMTKDKHVLGGKKNHLLGPGLDSVQKFITENFSSPNKDRPSSPVHSYPSDEAHLNRAKNLSNPNKYQPTSVVHNNPSEEGYLARAKNLVGPKKYPLTSPVYGYPSEEGYMTKEKNLLGEKKNHTLAPISDSDHQVRTQSFSSPNKDRPSSVVDSYPSEEAHLTGVKNLASPNKFQPTSTIHNNPSEEGYLAKDKNLSGPKKYQPTSPMHGYPSDESYMTEEKYLLGGKKNHPLASSSDNVLQVKTESFSSPNKDRPSSPIHSYPSEEADSTIAKKLSSPNKYHPTSPMHNNPSKEGYLTKAKNLLGPKKYQPTSLTHSYPPEEGYLTREKNLLGGKKNNPSGLGLGSGSDNGEIVRAANFPGQKNHWQRTNPLITNHPLDTSTNDLNESFNLKQESANHSPRSDLKRTGKIDNLSPRAQPIEPERRYTRPTFFGSTTQAHSISNTIDSHEAMRKYNGALVP